MPKQIANIEEFKKLTDKANECRVVRRGDKVKLKLRTKETLYVLAASKEEADGFLKGLKIKTLEL